MRSDKQRETTTPHIKYENFFTSIKNPFFNFQVVIRNLFTSKKSKSFLKREKIIFTSHKRLWKIMRRWKNNFPMEFHFLVFFSMLNHIKERLRAIWDENLLFPLFYCSLSGSHTICPLVLLSHFVMVIFYSFLNRHVHDMAMAMATETRSIIIMTLFIVPKICLKLFLFSTYIEFWSD